MKIRTTLCTNSGPSLTAGLKRRCAGEPSTMATTTTSSSSAPPRRHHPSPLPPSSNSTTTISGWPLVRMRLEFGQQQQQQRICQSRRISSSSSRMASPSLSPGWECIGTAEAEMMNQDEQGEDGRGGPQETRKTTMTAAAAAKRKNPFRFPRVTAVSVVHKVC